MRSTALFAPKILIGSLGGGSQNARLAAVVAEEFVRADVEVTRISLGAADLRRGSAGKFRRAGKRINLSR